MNYFEGFKAGKNPFHQREASVATLLLDDVSIRAKRCSLILSTLLDPGHNGTVCPTPERLQALLGVSRQELDEIVLELVESGNWRIQYNEITGEIINYDPIFMRNTNLMKEAKTFPAGVNQIKQLRYVKYSHRAVVAIAWVIANMRTHSNDLGYKACIRQKIVPPHQNWYIQGGKLVGRKLHHATYFKHPLLETGTFDANDVLAGITTLPDEMLTQPMSKTMKLSDFQAVGFTSITELMKAFSDLRRSGEWLVEMGDATGGSWWDRIVVFTPRDIWHRNTWAQELRAGGKNQTAWELRAGFYPNDGKVRNSNSLGSSSPDLGMSTHYLLLDPISLKPLYSGQTYLPAYHRLRLHMIGETVDKSEPDLLNGRELTDKALIMLPTCQVHVSQISDFEMRVIQVFEQAGCEFINEIRSAQKNDNTIRLDPKLLEMEYTQRRDFLNSVWATHGNVTAVDLSNYPRIKELMDQVISEFTVIESPAIDQLQNSQHVS